MKKEFIYAAVAVLALSGCSKNDVEPVVVTDSELLSFTVGVDPVQTKSMLEYDEGKVEDVQVFVFNHQGYLIIMANPLLRSSNVQREKRGFMPW